MLPIRRADNQRDAGDLVPKPVRAFVHLVLLAHHATMVGREYHNRVVRQVQCVQSFEQVADPSIRERHFTRVECLDALKLLRRHLIDFAGRADQLAAVVVRIILVRILLRRMPRLVRIEAVDIEKERPILSVHAHPGGRLTHDLSHERVLLRLPVTSAHEVLRNPALPCHFGHVRHEPVVEVDVTLRPGRIRIGLLSPNPTPAVEPTMKVLPRLHHMVHVGDERVREPVVAQRLRERHVL